MARTLPHPTSLGLSAHDRVGHYIRGDIKKSIIISNKYKLKSNNLPVVSPLFSLSTACPWLSSSRPTSSTSCRPMSSVSASPDPPPPISIHCSKLISPRTYFIRAAIRSSSMLVGKISTYHAKPSNNLFPRTKYGLHLWPGYQACHPGVRCNVKAFGIVCFTCLTLAQFKRKVLFGFLLEYLHFASK